MIDRLFKHWKSTVVALIILTLTGLLALGKITVGDFAIGMGTVLTVYAAFKKDNDL